MQRKSTAIKDADSRREGDQSSVRLKLSKGLAEKLCKISGETFLPREAVAIEAIRSGMNFLKRA